MKSRWKFEMKEDFKLVVTPECEEMLSFVHEAAKELEKNIMEREEKLVLSVVSNSGLQRLIDLCAAELSRRKTGL